MKKFLLALSALAFAAGCTVSELGNDTVLYEAPVFTAEFEGPDTRVYVDSDLKTHWTAGDRISIFTSTYNEEYIFNGSTGDKDGSFTLIDNSFHAGSEVPTIYAAYPYSPETKITSDGVISLTLPSVQSYAERSFGNGCNTMVAVTESKSSRILNFKNLCGYIVVKLYGEVTIKSITLTGNDGEKIAGQGIITPVYGQAPEILMSTSATESITLDCGDGVTLGKTADKASEFWFAVPPVTFNKGFTVEITDTYGHTKHKSVTSKRTVVRNVMNPMVPLFVDFSPLGWETFMIYNVDFDYDKLTTSGTSIGVEGTMTCPRRDFRINNNKLGLTWEEFDRYVLDWDLNMTYESFCGKYDFMNPKIILTSNGSAVQEPGAILPMPPISDKNTQIKDFNDIGTYYRGVFGTCMTPLGWEEPTGDYINISLTNRAEADGRKHYVYVLLEAFDNTTDIDIVLEFVYFIPQHQHYFTISQWTLNPDYLLNQHPDKPWMLNPYRPANINSPADYDKYGVVKGKTLANGTSQSNILEHFKEYSVPVSAESMYIFSIVNFTSSDVIFITSSYGAGVVGVNNGYCTVTLTGSELERVVKNWSWGGWDLGPSIVLSGASMYQETKEILIQVTEICGIDSTQSNVGYYYIVFDGLHAVIEFNPVAFGTYSNCSDYVLVHEMVNRVSDEYGYDVVVWDDNQKEWTYTGKYSSFASSVEVVISRLIFSYGDSAASFGGNLYCVSRYQIPVYGYNIVSFEDDGIEWWDGGASLQRDKYAGAEVHVNVTTMEGYKITIAKGYCDFSVLSAYNSAAFKNPNHNSDGKPSNPIWK